MEYEKRIQPMGEGSAGVLIPADVMKWLGLEVGDTVMLKAEEGKHGKFTSFWKKEDDKNETGTNKRVPK